MNRILPILTGFLLLFSFSCRKSDYYLADEQLVRDQGSGTGTVTWKKDKTYIVSGLVFVNDGQVLTIEAGTVIRAKTGQGNQSSALVVARGGKIIARGKPDQPIIFTVEGDDLEGSVPLKTRGLWGGLIILGNAPVHAPTGESFIEGIPISEPRGIYGGIDEDDNSGILEYVSIRHGGTNIGEGNEINGLTLGGVGRKTIINHIEVVSNADDGIEFFGGTVNCSNLAVAFCGDDAFDFDEGYLGKCQFLLALLDEDLGNHAAEHNGAHLPSQGKPFSKPEIYNCTYVGGGEENQEYLITFNENSAGIYRNSIFLNARRGIAIEYLDGSGSYAQFKSGKLEFSGNIFHNIEGNVADSLFRLDPVIGDPGMALEELASYPQSGNNKLANPGFRADSYPLRLLPSSTVFDGMEPYTSSWYQEVSYKGAFGSANWLQGWSALWKSGIVD